MTSPINPPGTPLIDSRGNITPPWYRFLVAIQKNIAQGVTTDEDGALFAGGAGATGASSSADVEDQLLPPRHDPIFPDVLIPPWPEPSLADIIMPDTAAYVRSVLKSGVALFDHYADVGNSGTSETDLYSDTLAAGQLGANGDKLEAEYGGVFVSSATATRQIKIHFAGTAIFDTGALTLSLSSAWTAFVTIIRVSGTVVRYMVSLTTEGAALSAYTAVGELAGLTLSGTNILKITGTAAGAGAASNDIVSRLGTILIQPAA